MTLSDLKQMKGLVSLTKIGEALGVTQATLPQRIRRGAPELTEEEARKIIDLLHKHGLTRKR